MKIRAVHLVRIGDDVIVKVESGGEWIEVIRECHDSLFSHIVEELGMEAARASRTESISGAYETLWPPASPRVYRS